MAGIGFRLQKLLVDGSLTGTARAYLYAGIISSGPWIISILSIIILNILLHRTISDAERQLFSTTITHTYALALILTGALQFVLNRFAADCLSAKRREDILPSFVAAMALTILISATVAAVIFGVLTEEHFYYKAAAISLFVYVCLIFVASNYLSVLHHYRSVVVAFAAGYLVSCVATWYGAATWGVEAALAGFATGHLLLLVLLIHRLQQELSFGNAYASWKFLGHFKRYPSLILCGLFYNLGIWIDKILFWQLSESHIRVTGILHASPEYDLSIYLSLLSIVPGMTVFFLRLETDFAACFRDFFEATNNGRPLRSIVLARNEMIESLRSGFSQLIAVQLIVTLGLLVYAHRIGEWLQIGAIQAGIFRVTLVGAFLLMLFLAMLTVLFYLDDRKGALFCCAIFVVGNAGLSLATLLANEAWYGFGFVVAAGFAMVVAAWRVNTRITTFERYIFVYSGT